MALIKTSEPPKGAVKLTEQEAAHYAWEMVKNWDSLLDTWALRWGPGILGGLSSFTGLMINQHYRRKLKLGRYGHMASILPLAFLPGTFTALFHRELVGTEMLLMKNDTCPLCLELRSVFIQMGLGIAYPIILAPWASLMLASRYATCRVPSLTGEGKQLFKFTLKITRPFYGTLTTLFAVQAVAAIIIPYFEMSNNLTMRKKILEIENKIDSELLFEK